MTAKINDTTTDEWNKTRRSEKRRVQYLPLFPVEKIQPIRRQRERQSYHSPSQSQKTSGYSENGISYKTCTWRRWRFQIKQKSGHTTKTWVWDYRREEMDADSPFHSTQRVTRGEFGRHGKIIMMLDENIKWHDGWTNRHVVFTISKKKGQPVFGEVTSSSLCTSKVQRNQPLMWASRSKQTRPSHNTGEVALPGNFRTVLSPSQTKD